MLGAQDLANIGLGISIALGSIKLIRFVASRRKGPDESDTAEGPATPPTVREYKTASLFPNGEKDEMIAAITELRLQNLARRKENSESKLCQDEIKATLTDISARLEKHGI